MQEIGRLWLWIGIISLKKSKAKVGKFQLPVDPTMGSKIRALLISEQELKTRIAELERRETAYLEMLTQADDMWAEMEGGYKKKIEESQATETQLKGKVRMFPLRVFHVKMLVLRRNGKKMFCNMYSMIRSW